jgi:deoxyribodipyrimidine photo-lyase
MVSDAMDTFVIWWCRRDIRLHDNAALFHALNSGLPVQPIFIFDHNILDELRNSNSSLTLDKRVEFIYKELLTLKNKLEGYGSTIWILYGDPVLIWQEIISRNRKRLKAVFTNHDYEPYALKRDGQVKAILSENDIAFHTFKDQCIFEHNEVAKDDGKPYTVFTPYSRKWRAKLTSAELQSYPSEQLLSNLCINHENLPVPALEQMGFTDGHTDFPGRNVDNAFLVKYGDTRDFPAQQGTSRLGIHLRFGTISIRQLARQAMIAGGDTYLNELIWRDFYMMIFSHFPYVVSQTFKPAYDRIPWRLDDEGFQRWCDGMTGYPIVDAGMRELNATGYMHNRVRMITASFLTKHLLIDWRRGEAYFAGKLLDYELSSNNGGWQWAAGTGCDAAPYFRVFNPSAQAIKFDNKLAYIRKLVPELDTLQYPAPMVEHNFARNRAIATYAAALKGY